MPSRDGGPSPASAIIEPIAATANAPLLAPRKNTVGLSGQSPPTWPATTSSDSAMAELMQPPTVQAASEPKRRPRLPRVVATATSIMPSSTPPFWTPASFVDSPTE